MTEQPDPIFIARFENGHETCVGHYSPPDQLDLARALERSRQAFTDLMKKKPPPIINARFEFNGVVLAEYNADELSRFMQTGQSPKPLLSPDKGEPRLMREIRHQMDVEGFTLKDLLLTSPRVRPAARERCRQAIMGQMYSRGLSPHDFVPKPNPELRVVDSADDDGRQAASALRKQR
jgi:hypothetical protein